MSDREALLRDGIQAWNEGNIDAVLELLDADVRIRLSGSFAGLGPEYRGHEGFHKFWQEMREMWHPLEMEVTSLEEIDDLMLSGIRFRGTGREGIEVERTFYFLWELDGTNRVVAYQSFSERDEAIAAASEARAKGGLPT